MESNADLARQGIRIEWWSTAWMSVEFLVGVAAGVRAHSILLIAFGLDSLLEIVSGGALIWRLQKERSGAPAAVIDRAETRSSRIVGSVLLLLAGYIVLTSAYNLVTRQGADSSVPGLIIAVASLVLMPFSPCANASWARHCILPPWSKTGCATSHVPTWPGQYSWARP